MQLNRFREFTRLVGRTRTFRRFYEDRKIGRAALLKLVNLARLSASAGNRQTLKFMVAHDPRRNALIFPCLAWAGYLKDWPGPAPGERPAGYIIILGDQRLAQDFGCDHGIAAQSMLLGASVLGLGGCLVGSINRARLRAALKIAPHFEILLALALGRPREKVKIEKARDGNIKYWRDRQGRHHVPKRGLPEIIVG